MNALSVGHFVETGTWAITDSAHGTTMAFLTISFAEIFHSFNMRSQTGSIFALKTQNKFLLLSSLGSIIATVLVMKVPVLQNAFGLSTVGLREYIVAAGIGILIIPLVEVMKAVRRGIGKKEK